MLRSFARPVVQQRGAAALRAGREQSRATAAGATLQRCIAAPRSQPVSRVRPLQQRRAFSTQWTGPSATTAPSSSDSWISSHPRAPESHDELAPAEAGAAAPSLLRRAFEWAVLQAGGGSVPKGWERFFPENKPGTPPSAGGAGPTPGSKPSGGGSSGGGSSGSGGPRKPAPRRPDPDDPFSPGTFLLYGGVFAFLAWYWFSARDSSRDSKAVELTYQDFRSRFLEPRLVERLTVDTLSNKVRVYLKKEAGGSSSNTDAASNSAGVSVENNLAAAPKPNDDPDYFFYIGSVDAFERQLMDSQRELGIDSHDWVSVRYVAPSLRSSGEGGRIPWFEILLIGGVIWWIRKNGNPFTGGGGGGKKNPFNFGKSTAHMIKPGEIKVTFADVAGLDEAKVEVMEFVKFLQDPARFTKLGAKIPRGALLQGPPGTGKTLLAKAVAGEAAVPFFSISGSDFLEMFVGVGASRVRDLFAQARAQTPCIIFIDEIDAVGRARNAKGFGSNDEREATLNQLLVEMDGMGSTEGVVVLAGTNRMDMLDKALLRPGRFDRHISIGKPDIKGRAQIFMVHLKPLRCSPKHSMEDLAQRLAALTPGFAGADIHNLCNEAALIAARAEKEYVELADFEQASDRVIGGMEKKSSKMNADEKSLVAHHEAGHAVAAWFLEHADPLLKVTIVPRTSGALGFAQYLPKELTLYHQGQLLDMMAMALGGRAAEQIFFGRVSTGASDDLQKVTRIAQAQVTTYGMSERLGQVCYAADGGENQFTKPFSESTAQAIDEEVRALIATTYTRTLALLETHRAKVAALASKLIELENVNHDVLLEVLGPRPFQSDAYTLWRQQGSEGVKKAEAEEAERKKREAAAAATPEAEIGGEPQVATA